MKALFFLSFLALSSSAYAKQCFIEVMADTKEDIPKARLLDETLQKDLGDKAIGILNSGEVFTSDPKDGMKADCVVRKDPATAVDGDRKVSLILRGDEKPRPRRRFMVKVWEHRSGKWKRIALANDFSVAENELPKRLREIGVGMLLK